MFVNNIELHIREWRRTGGNQPGLLGTGQAIHDSISSHTASESLKKQTLTPSQSYGGPSSTFHPQRVVAPKMKNKPVSEQLVYLMACSLDICIHLLFLVDNLAAPFFFKIESH